MNKQKQYFINGLILFIIALTMITIIPYCIDKLKMAFEKDTFSELEFFAMTASALFFLFSPKYYKNQVIIIIFGFLYYFLFSKFYPFLLSVNF